MAAATGWVVFRLDEVTANGRLTSVARRIGAQVRLARSQARTSGVPRRIDYDTEALQLTVRRPQFSAGNWDWNPGLSYDLGSSGVRIDRILLEGGLSASEEHTVRIDSSGCLTPHAAVLVCGERYAVVWLGRNGESELTWPQGAPAADSYELLRLNRELHSR
jgi:Tfp pilus assembly protein FimT